MATPERHEMVLDVIEDILDLLALNDEASQNFRNVLYVTRNITEHDIKRARELTRSLINTFVDQRY